MSCASCTVVAQQLSQLKDKLRRLEDQVQSLTQSKPQYSSSPGSTSVPPSSVTSPSSSEKSSGFFSFFKSSSQTRPPQTTQSTPALPNLNRSNSISYSLEDDIESLLIITHPHLSHIFLPNHPHLHPRVLTCNVMLT
jgi:hypothetical protein